MISMDIVLGGTVTALPNPKTLSSSLTDDSAEKNEELLNQMVHWLSRLRVLEGAPFRYLTPSEEMLPNESIRFFHVDRNWLDALVDGAISVGRLGSRESNFDAIRYEVLMAALNDRERDKRPHARNLLVAHLATGVPCPTCSATKGNNCVTLDGLSRIAHESRTLPTAVSCPVESCLAPPGQRCGAEFSTMRVDTPHDRRIEKYHEKTGASQPTGGTVTGFLFRSSVVRDYPGIEISAYNSCIGEPDDQGRITTDPDPWQKKYRVQVMRQQRLSDTILLCLFNGTPTHLRIKEPYEGIRIGVDTPTASGATPPYDVNLKDTLNADFFCSVCNAAIDTSKEITCPLGCSPPANPFKVHKARTRVLPMIPDTSLSDNSVLDIEGIYVAGVNAQSTPVDQDSALVTLQMLQFPYQQDFVYDSLLSVADMSELPREFEEVLE